MKELTIEEKAKAYDKAVEKAKIFKEHLLEINDKGYADEMDYIFPELAESEDEKIRKHLITLFKDEYGKNSNARFAGIKVKDIIAWLEKQSEQKSMKTCAEYYNKDSELKMPELSVFQNKLADILMQREYEGSTETEEDVASARLDYELAAIRISEELLPLAIMQKPTEWSEEDERERNHCIDFLNHPDMIKATPTIANGCKEWLKSLRPQNTWKPSEEMLEALYRAIPENTMAISEDEMLLDKLYQGLKYGRVLSNK